MGEAAADSHRLDARAWQALASLQLNSNRAADVASRLAEGRLDPLAVLRTRCGLSRPEIKRLDGINHDQLSVALARGIEPWPTAELPERIRDSGAPPVLFGWGDPSCLEAPCVAIVGTRGSSAYGEAAAQKFAEALARAGVTVISGGAIGIDAAAHKGAMDAGGKTVAVLACGVDVIQPPRHGALFERIRGQGCLLSMFAVGAPATKDRFRPRNGLIAACCDATLIIEAPTKSGALHTAGAAAELGRHVFVLPGSIAMESFRGSHALIRDGAILVDHPNQVLEVLDLTAASADERVEFGPSQRAILGALSATPSTAEMIADRVGIGADEVMAGLTDLELEGVIVREPSGYALRP